MNLVIFEQDKAYVQKCLENGGLSSGRTISHPRRPRPLLCPNPKVLSRASTHGSAR